MIPLPHLCGPWARAWRFDLAGIQRSAHQPHATIAAWALYVPWANSSWDSYAVQLIHLRNVPGDKPPKIFMPGATHEVFVFAIHPAWPFDLSESLGGYLLKPTNYAGQFTESSDQAAIDRVIRAIEEVNNGMLSPDTDYTQHWIARFGSSNIRGGLSEAGRTIISIGGREIVIDPAPLDRKPIDILCHRCGQPNTANSGVPTLVGVPLPPGFDVNVCIRCQRSMQEARS